MTLQPRMFYQHFVAIKRVTLHLTHDSTEKAGIIEFCTEKFESLIALINSRHDRKELNKQKRGYVYDNNEALSAGLGGRGGTVLSCYALWL